MNLFILSQYKLIQELYKNDDFFEILINIDDFFDLINLYVFPNWLNAEVVDVDFLKYYTSITLNKENRELITFSVSNNLNDLIQNDIRKDCSPDCIKIIWFF